MEINWKIILLAGLAVGASVVAFQYATASDSSSLVESVEKKKKKPKKTVKKKKIAAVDVPIVEKAEIQEDSLKAKSEGNSLFKEKKYLEAVEAYSRAIALKKDSVYYGNRAACYLNLVFTLS